MILTEAEKAQATELGLSQQEMRLAKATRIAPERYAEVKAEIEAEQEALQAQLTAFGDAILERARYAPPGRGQRPALEAEDRD